MLNKDQCTICEYYVCFLLEAEDYRFGLSRGCQSKVCCSCLQSAAFALKVITHSWAAWENKDESLSGDNAYHLPHKTTTEKYKLEYETKQNVAVAHSNQFCYIRMQEYCSILKLKRYKTHACTTLRSIISCSSCTMSSLRLSCRVDILCSSSSLRCLTEKASTMRCHVRSDMGERKYV